MYAKDISTNSDLNGSSYSHIRYVAELFCLNQRAALLISSGGRTYSDFPPGGSIFYNSTRWQQLYIFPPGGSTFSYFNQVAAPFIIPLDGSTYSYFNQVAAPFIIPLDGSTYSYFNQVAAPFIIPLDGSTYSMVSSFFDY